MANGEHLSIIALGVQAWNRWRGANPEIKPGLEQANFSFRDLHGADFRGTNFSGANFNGAILTRADLSGADFSEAYLGGTNFNSAKLGAANFTNAVLGWTSFVNNDLSCVKGLKTVRHLGPSVVSIDTLYKSRGQFPERFLRGCGFPNNFITYLPALVGAEQAVQFYSCFISYSSKDEDFARRLYSRMRDEHLRVWFAPEEMKGGQQLHEQIDRAIQIHDRLLIVLSEHSLKSKWVETEMRRARRTEKEENRRKLFPIRLVDFETIQRWECFDADTGEDLAVEVRKYFVPDFSNWKDHDSFEAGFARLLRDLRAAEAG